MEFYKKKRVQTLELFAEGEDKTTLSFKSALISSQISLWSIGSFYYLLISFIYLFIFFFASFW